MTGWEGIENLSRAQCCSSLAYYNLQADECGHILFAIAGLEPPLYLEAVHEGWDSALAVTALYISNLEAPGKTRFRCHS